MSLLRKDIDDGYNKEEKLIIQQQYDKLDEKLKKTNIYKKGYVNDKGRPLEINYKGIIYVYIYIHIYL